MPARKRKRRERTHDWQEIQQYTLWPEQEDYEQLRPIVLFGETAAERAKETGGSPRTLHYQAQRFEQLGMISCFTKNMPRRLSLGGIFRKICASSSLI
jgi:putative transposase